MINGVPLILIVRLSAIGDVVRVLPALHALRNRYPNAQIDWAVEQKSYEIISGHPALDQIHVFERGEGILSNLGAFMAFAKIIRDAKYDWVIDFHGILKSGLLTRMSGAKKRYGFARPRSQEFSFLSTNIKVPLVSKFMNRIEENLELCKTLEAKVHSLDVVIDIPEDVEDSIDAYFQEAQFTGQGMALDVTDQKQVDNLMATLAQQEKTPSILVNNAGIAHDNLMLRMQDDEWYGVIETNLNSVYRLSKACLKPMFRARWGRIINIGSVVGSSGNSGQANYTAAKAGIIGFTKSLAQEMASRGLTVNTVSPGFIATDMTEKLADVVKTETLKRIPMKRMGAPEDIANAVVFLASDAANYITGQTVHVNGGMYME